MSRWVLLALAAAVACGKTEGERARDLNRCSETSTDALEIQLCLETQYRWKESEAQTAAATRAQQIDSVRQWREDSAWAASGPARHAEVRECAGVDQERCLLTRFGWPPERARAAAESVWTADATAHRRELQACARELQANIGSCLMLRYKWPPPRALAVSDSIQRARMR